MKTLGWFALATLVSLPLLAPGAPASGPTDAGDGCLELRGAKGTPIQFSDTHVFPGDYDLGGPVAKPLQAHGPYGVVGPIFVRINVGGPRAFGSDGVEARGEPDVVMSSIALYLPGKPGQQGVVVDDCRFPTILVDSIYLLNYGDASSFESPSEHFAQFLKPRLVDNLVSHGYVLAFTSPRGLAGNDGCTDVWGPNERRDLHTKLDWIVDQPWSDGQVGMFGLSGPGISAWLGASTHHRALKTIVPINAAVDFQSTFSHRGSIGFATLLSLLGYYFVNPSNEPLSPASGTPEDKARWIVHRALCPEIPEHAVAELLALFNGGIDPRTGERFEHWTDRDFRPALMTNTNVSVLIINGLRDTIVHPSNTYPWLNGLEARGVVVKHILGQWEHGYADAHPATDPVSRSDIAEILLRWFNATLKHTGEDVGPRAQVQDSSLRWRSEPLGQSWPPEDAVARPLYLSIDEPAADPAATAAARGRLAAAPGPRPSRAAVPPVADYVPLVANENAGAGYTFCWSQIQDLVRDGTGEEVPPVWEDDNINEVAPVPACPLTVMAMFKDLPKSLDHPCAACPTFDLPVEHELRFAGVPALDLRVTPVGATGYLAAHLYAVPPDDADLVAARPCHAGGTGRMRLGHAVTDLRYAQPDQAPGTPMQVNDVGVPILRPLEPLDVHLDFEPLDAVVPAGWTLRLVLSQGGGGWKYPTPSSPLLVDTDDASVVLTLHTFERSGERFFRAPGHMPPVPPVCASLGLALVGATAIGAIMPSL